MKFAVILARAGGKWVLCRHRGRSTVELPGGHREPGETIDDAAQRELREETGAVAFTLAPVCVYAVIRSGERSFGKLYFAEIASFEPLHCEIEEITLAARLPAGNWTYPLIQPRLIDEAKRRGFLPADAI